MIVICWNLKLDELYISGGALRKQAINNECETVSVKKLLLMGYDVSNANMQRYTEP